MKKNFHFLCLSLFLLCTQLSVAQIKIGTSESMSLNKAGRFSKKNLAGFKKRTTIISLPDWELKHKAAWEKEIAKVWTITPFKIVGFSELSTYASPDFNLFMFNVYQVMKGNSVHSHSTYDLFRFKEKRGRDLYARAFVHTGGPVTLMPKPFSFTGEATDHSTAQAYTFFYREGPLHNFNLPTVKAYLKFINNSLQTSREQGIYSGINDPAKLSQLKKSTLYLPDYTQETFNKFTGKRKTKPLTREELEDAYPYTITYITKEALDQKLLNSDETFYFLSYISSSSDKYVNVISSAGDIIYSSHASMSYNFKAKDLKELARAVRKH